MSSTSDGFDLSKMSTATKILLGAGILYLIDLFLPWQKACVEVPGLPSPCLSVSGASGIGVLNLLLVIALLAWEGMALANVNVQAPRALISAALAGGIVVFTVLKILVDMEAIYIFAWIGLLLAIAIGYGGWMRWQEHQAGAGAAGGTVPPPANPTGGGFTS
jgi:CDP-diglyceride synthetase